ncbi:MAG: PIN domain-containing protein [Myxococcaceae bacterium]|nr:PIN domain-containing protein [Myxococcaceae bacterium]
MIAIDTNVLVYAHRLEAAEHRVAVRLLEGLANGDDAWGLPWPCAYEFLRVVTHPRVFERPSTTDEALSLLEDVLDSPTVQLLGEGLSHRHFLRQALHASQATGNLMHDAHLAALLVEHGVSRFLTSDADFARFRGFEVKNPFRR